MAGIFERDFLDATRIQEVGDAIFIAEDTKTPLTALLKRGKGWSQLLATHPVQKIVRKGFKGTMDGYDINTFNKTVRDAIQACAMWMMTEGWMVTKLAQLARTAGVKDEVVKQKADDGLALALMIEQQIASDDDLQIEDRANNLPWTSRGIGSWLSAAAQSFLPVNAKYRPAAGAVLTTPLDEITPAAFKAALEAAANQIGSPVDLTGFCGLKLKTQMTSWTQLKTGLQTGESSLVNYNGDIASRKLTEIVDFFEFESGRVKTVATWNLLTNRANGENTDYSPRSGFFMDLGMWELCWLEAPAEYECPQQSGGPRGYHDAVYGLRCLNPLGQVMVKTNLDT